VLGRAMAGLAGGAQLLARLLTPQCGTQRIERLAGGTQHRTGLRDAAMATEPGAVRELRASLGEQPAGQLGPQRVLEARLGLRIIGSRAAGVAQPHRHPWRWCPRGRRLQSPRERAGPVAVAAALDLVDQRTGTGFISS